MTDSPNPPVVGSVMHTVAPAVSNKPVTVVTTSPVSKSTLAESLARVALIPTPPHDKARARKEIKKSEMKVIHDQIVAILKEFDNKESEIPLNHTYWGLVNQYRGMR